MGEEYMKNRINSAIKAIYDIRDVLRDFHKNAAEADTSAEAVYIPPLEEQTAAAAYLSGIDRIESVVDQMQNVGNIPSCYLSKSAGYKPPSQQEINEAFAGYSRAQIAQLLGVNRRTVGKWVTGESEIHYAPWRLFLIMTGKVFEPVLKSAPPLPPQEKDQKALE